MAKSKKWNLTFKQLSTLHGVAQSALKCWSKKGHNLNDEALVSALVLEYKQKHPVIAETRRNSKGKFVAPRSLGLSDLLGLQGSLQRLREAERDAAQAYAEAKTKGDSSAYTLRIEWLELCEAMRKAEKDNPDVAEANKRAITVDELEATLNGLFVRLRTSLEGLPTRVTKELDQNIGVIVINNIREEINNYIAELYSCKFLSNREEEE